MSSVSRNLVPRLAGGLVLVVSLIGAPAQGRLLRETQIERSPGVLAMNARSVLAEPAIREAVCAWIAHPGARLYLRPPAGAFGRVWATALRSWLVALGIPGERVIIRPPLQHGATLLLEVRGSS